MLKRQLHLLILILILLIGFIAPINAQTLNKAQWPINWSNQQVVLDLSLSSQIKKDSALTPTQIPDKRSEKLYVLTNFSLLPNIKSTLYADHNKLVWVNYSSDGKYIDHRIVTVKSVYDPVKPIYSIVDTKEKQISLYHYNDFDSGYDVTSIQMHPNGHFEDIMPIEDMGLNTTSKVTIMGCSYYGLEGTYPINEKWLLISMDEQTAKSATTLRHGQDFLGGLITLIEDPYEYPKEDNSYLFAFRGNHNPEEVQFDKPQNMAEQQIKQLMQQLKNTQWSYLSDDGEAISKLKANIHPISKQLQLIYLPQSDDGGILIIREKEKIVSVTGVERYNLLKIGGKLYLVASLPSEGSRYIFYEMIDNQFKQLEDYTIACC